MKDKTPEKQISIAEGSIQKLYWNDKYTDHVICNIDNCNTVIAYKKSASRGIYKHIESHSSTRPSRKRPKISERPFDELSIKQKISLVIALKMIGQNKISAFKATSSGMISTYQAILSAAGVNIEENDVIESRRQIMRTVNSFAEKIRSTVKDEINGQSVTFIHDDSRSSTGNNEAIRAITACFVKNNMLVRRFLHLEYVEDKDGKSVAESIKKIADEYGVTDYQIAADGASVNLAAANLLRLVQHTCWSHTTHLIAENALKSMRQNFPAFDLFYKSLEKLINKCARRHINAKLSKEEGFIKIPTLSTTRWLSRRDCLNAIIRNWTILQNHKSIIGLSDTEWKHFDNLKLFEELFELIDTATMCLLKFEVQQQTSSHTVIPTISKWIYKLLQFTMNGDKSNLGRLLAKEFVDQIDHYCFGKVGSTVKPRLHKTHIVQSLLNPESHLLNKIKSKISSTTDAIGGEKEILEANESIDLRFSRIFDRAWPHLKETYRRLYITENNSQNSDNDSDDSDFDMASLGPLSQEQRDKLQKYFQKKEDQKVYYALKNEYNKFKSFISEFKNWNDNLTGEGDFSSLIRQYITMKINRKDTHILFWTMKDVKLTFPILQKIVMDTIHVPASNCAVESLFSHVTDVKNFKRSLLSDKNLNDILTLFYSDLYMENSVTNFFKSNVNK